MTIYPDESQYSFKYLALILKKALQSYPTRCLGDPFLWQHFPLLWTYHYLQNCKKIKKKKKKKKAQSFASIAFNEEHGEETENTGFAEFYEPLDDEKRNLAWNFVSTLNFAEHSGLRFVNTMLEYRPRFFFFLFFLLTCGGTRTLL